MQIKINISAIITPPTTTQQQQQPRSKERELILRHQSQLHLLAPPVCRKHF
jgi:hypothetical protein